MSIWDSYPDSYRSKEVQHIIKAVAAGECVSVIGLSGAGKSNLVGFLAQRVSTGIHFILVDCNDLPTADSASLMTALNKKLDESSSVPAALSSVITLVGQELNHENKKLCFILDRFDLFQLDSPAGKTTANHLRSLRDRVKYNLTFVFSTRRPLDPASELSELVFANTLWLGALTQEDAFWSVGQFASRHDLHWNDEMIRKIVSLSGGYPSMLRGVCEAAAAGLPVELEAMRNTPAIQFRRSEFWSDVPDVEAVEKSGLLDLPLLMEHSRQEGGKGELTAAEQKLLDTLIARSGQVCSKEELIQAVWPDEKLATGLRDDSLTQLVHRLREKVDPLEKNRIQTLPGRGYRYQK
jgi:hypothetical protein